MTARLLIVAALVVAGLVVRALDGGTVGAVGFAAALVAVVVAGGLWLAGRAAASEEGTRR